MSDSFFNLENNFSFLSIESLKLYFSIGYFSLMYSIIGSMLFEYVSKEKLQLSSYSVANFEFIIFSSL